MKGCILIFSLLLSQTLYAQLPQVRLGLGASGGVKFNFLSRHGPNFGPLGSLQLWLAGIIKGKEENNFSLLIKTGFAYENTSYLSLGPLRFGTDHVRIFINPEAFLPLIKEKICMSLGFGLEYNLETRLWINGVSSSDIMNTYYYGNLEYKERKLLPYLSCGSIIRTNSSFSVLLAIKQYLQNAYYKNERLDFGTGAPSMDLIHQPFCLQLGLLYRFSNL